MKLRGLGVAVGVVLVAGCASVVADEMSETDAFMWAYTEAWNEHDAEVVGLEIYEMTAEPEAQVARFERQFEALRGQGYSHSTIHEIKTCLTGEGTAWAGMKYTRLTKSGEPLGPKDRASQYTLTFKDGRGWRIASVGGYDPAQPLMCP